MTTGCKMFRNGLVPVVCMAAVLQVMPATSSAALLTAETYARTESSVSNSVSSTDDSVYSNVSAPWSQLDGSTARATASGDQNGGMYASAYLVGEDTSSARITQSVTFTNDTGADQNYFFDFTILPGRLHAATTNFYSPEYQEAGYEINITLDGVSLFESSASVRVQGSGYQYQEPAGTPVAYLNQSGVDLGGSYFAMGGAARYSWNEYVATLDLGVIQAGDSFVLEYDIYAYTAGYILEDTWVCYLECGMFASSVFGDPNHLSTAPMTDLQLTHQAVNPTSVPEPGIWLLMGTGLFGLAMARRRRG